jgi:hypothetical protein
MEEKSKSVLLHETDRGTKWLLIKGKIYYNFKIEDKEFTLLYLPDWDGPLLPEVEEALELIRIADNGK